MNSSDVSFLAAATHCREIDDRPSIGVIMFNIAYIDRDNIPNTEEELIDATTHEIFHTLGFMH